MLHLVQIFPLPDGASSERAASVEARDNARELLKKCIKEIVELKCCGECYMKDINCHESLRVCSRPHLVVWAQFSKFPYWPCKLLQIGECSKQPLQVFFFGDKDIANVNYANCYLYSEEYPNESIPDQYKERIESGVRVRKSLLICSCWFIWKKRYLIQFWCSISRKLPGT